MEKEKNETENSGNRYIDLLKWFIGSFVLGGAGLLINSKIQRTELELKRMEADSKLLEVVTKSNKENDSLEYRYLSFVKTFITTDSIKASVGRRILELQNLLSTKATDEAINATRGKQLKLDTILTGVQKLELNNADTFLRKKAKNQLVDINALKNEEDKIVAKYSSIDSFTIENFNAVNKVVTPIVVDKAYVLVGSSQTLWCKEGYYVEFNNSLRIGINSLSAKNKTIIVNFKDISDSKNDLIDDNVKLSVQSPYTLNVGNYRYQITLNYIGAAGKNPFTKAAYITVATYKK